MTEELANEGYVELTSVEQLRTVQDTVYEWVNVPEWKMRVRVRGLTGRGRDAWEAAFTTAAGAQMRTSPPENFRARMVAQCIVGEDGKRLLSDKDVAWLGEKSAAGLDRVFDVARRLSRLTTEDVEELTGESSSDRSADNGSGSLPISVSP